MGYQDNGGSVIFPQLHHLADDLGLAAYMADHIIVMKQGRVVDAGDREQILHDPSDPYTRNLLASVPAIGGYSYV